jgi:hypothetical protein
MVRSGSPESRLHVARREREGSANPFRLSRRVALLCELRLEATRPEVLPRGIAFSRGCLVSCVSATCLNGCRDPVKAPLIEPRNCDRMHLRPDR